MDLFFIQFAVVTGNTVKLYNAKIIKMKYRLIQIQEIYCTYILSSWFGIFLNQLTKVGVVVGRSTTNNRFPTSECGITNALLKYVMFNYRIMQVLLFLPHFLNHRRPDTKGCFVQIIEKSEKSEVDCRQMMTRSRFSSLLDVIHAFCQYIFFHLYTHI